MMTETKPKADAEAMFTEFNWIAGGLAAASTAGFLVICSLQELRTPHYVAGGLFAVAIPFLTAALGMLKRENTYDAWPNRKSPSMYVALPALILGTLSGVFGFFALFYAINALMGYLFMMTVMTAAISYWWHEHIVLKHSRE